jgi:hypothetical protein
MSSDPKTDVEESRSGDSSYLPEPITVKVRRLFSPVLPSPASPGTTGSNRTVDRFESELPPPVCDCCGYVIESDDQQCPARPEGVCAA